MKYQTRERVLVMVVALSLTGLSAVADETDGIRGISLTDLASDSHGVRTNAVRRLRDQLGAPQNPREPLALSEEEVHLLVQLVGDLWESRPEQLQRRDPRIAEAFSSLDVCANLTRDLLCRCENRKALAFALEHALDFSNAWSVDNEDFVLRWLGADAEFRKVRVVTVGPNHVVAALILSEVATPELLLDLIATGEAKAPTGFYRRGGGSKKDDFLSMAAYVMAEKLEIRRSRGEGGLTKAEDLPIPENAPAAELAREVRALAAQIQDPNSGIVRDMREEAEKSTESQ